MTLRCLSTSLPFQGLSGKQQNYDSLAYVRQGHIARIIFHKTTEAPVDGSHAARFHALTAMNWASTWDHPNWSTLGANFELSSITRAADQEKSQSWCYLIVPCWATKCNKLVDLHVLHSIARSINQWVSYALSLTDIPSNKHPLR